MLSGLFLFAAISLSATPMPIDDAARQLTRDIAETGGYTHGFPSHVELTPDGSTVLFLRSGPRDAIGALWSFDVKTGASAELASARSLLGGKEEQLSPEERARRERQRIVGRGLAGYQLSEDGSLILIPLSGELFVIERISRSKPKHLDGVEGATDARFSPDGRFVSFIRDHDVWICEWRTGSLRAVTRGGTEDISHGEAEFAAQEELSRFEGYWWSPDSTCIVWEESDTRQVPKAYIADPSRPDKAPASFPYPFAGKTNATVRVFVSALDGSAPRAIDWDRGRYPYLVRVDWEKNAPLSLLVIDRVQRNALLLAVDPVEGPADRPAHHSADHPDRIYEPAVNEPALRELLHEHDDAWIDVAQDMPHWLPDGRFLWMSEADGEWRLSLHEKDGRKIRVLNPGNDFRLEGLLQVDVPHGSVRVSGAVEVPDRDVWELSLEGATPPRRLTPQAPGMHLRRYAREAPAFVEIDSSLHARQSAPVFSAEGQQAGSLPSVASAPPFVPNVERTTVGEFEALVIRPRDFVPGRKYPVLDFVYGGPSEGVVFDTQAGPGIWRQQWFADRGFIVVAANNHGIHGRGRAWGRAIQGDFGTAPLEDQVAAVKALASTRPEMDLARVGITGWSFGGYLSALAVARRGDFFKAAIAGAPVVEWQDYDTCYTERYLGLPQENPEAYRKSNVTTWVAGLNRPLLLIHGTADDNVYFLHSLKLADALYKAGKPFELLPIAGQTHMASRIPEHAIRIDERMLEFFQRTLVAPDQGAAAMRSAAP